MGRRRPTANVDGQVLRVQCILTGSKRHGGDHCTTPPSSAGEAPHNPCKSPLFCRFLIAIPRLAFGALVGALWPNFGGGATNDWIKALGRRFIKLIKM